MPVAHDPRRALAVEVGGQVVRDTGTLFDAVREPGGGPSLGAAEGAVLFDPDAASLGMERGQAGYLTRDSARLDIVKVDLAAGGRLARRGSHL